MLQPPTLARAARLEDAFLGVPSRRLFASRDIAETRSLVARVMKPHELSVLGHAGRVQARMHHASFGDISLSRLCYGADVAIDPGALGDFFLVMMPLAGAAEVRCGNTSLHSRHGLASVASPSQPLSMRWSAECDQLMVRITRPFLERMLAAQRGQPLAQPLEFRADFEWRASPAWQCVLKFLIDCAESGLEPGANPLLLARAEEMVALTLLTEQAHNYADQALPRRGAVLPRHVRRVQEWLRAHADQPVTTAQLAEVGGCSLRSLYAGFQEFCGTSPMQYLRELRLVAAHADLLAGGPAASVSGIALRWGFTHLGRFSAEYKARFGEHPRQTLRQA